MTRLTIEISGITPEAKGSKSAVMWGDRPGLIESGTTESRARKRAWQNTVEKAAWAEAARVGLDSPMDGPLTVVCLFRMPKPQRPKFPAAPATRPDVDKILRCTLDGLNPVIVDDARIVDIHASQVWADSPEQAGAVISVAEFPEADQ